MLLGSLLGLHVPTVRSTHVEPAHTSLPPFTFLYSKSLRSWKSTPPTLRYSYTCESLGHLYRPSRSFQHVASSKPASTHAPCRFNGSAGNVTPRGCESADVHEGHELFDWARRKVPASSV